MQDLPRMYAYAFGYIYPMYVEKVIKKGRTEDELQQIIAWLTGYNGAKLQQAIDDERTMQEFFAKAPALNPDRKLITGVICGVRVEDITEPTMQEIRYMDKIVDELAKGKAIEKIMRKG